MKKLIDRISARYIKMENKDFYFIFTVVINNKSPLKRTIKGFIDFFDYFYSSKGKGVVDVMNTWDIGYKNNSSGMEQVFDMGKNVQKAFIVQMLFMQISKHDEKRFK